MYLLNAKADLLLKGNKKIPPSPAGKLSIQKSESPKGYSPCSRAVDVVHGEVGIRLALHLLEALVGTAYFDDDVAVNAEVARLDATIFHSMLR